MYARIGSWRGTADELERWIDRSRTQVVPGVRQEPGSKGVLLLLDRDGGQALTITLWEDEEAMHASEERRAALQQGTHAVTGATVATTRYEVIDASW
jgi:heme-degrading monooxygenase HmoA